MTWQNFETACLKYLIANYGQYAYFESRGGSNSTEPDILVTTQNKRKFYIEVKMPTAQCKQFVLLPDWQQKTFIYSPKNKHHLNPYMYQIIEHMNKHFTDYAAAGTTGKEINLVNAQHIFANCITTMYQEDGVLFFLTGNNTLFPLEQFSSFFDITATFRIKRSGSAAVGKKNISSVLEYVENNYPINTYNISQAKLYVNSPSDLDKYKFSLDDYEYMFSQRDNSFEIRRLSNTFNANVIFSIAQKQNVAGMTHQEFINALLQL